MTSSNGELKPEPQGTRERRSPSPRSPGGDDLSAAGKPSPSITYRVKTPGQVLHEAIALKDLDGLARIIRASPDCIDVRNHFGRTPLHMAAESGQNEMVKFLVSKGAEVDARSRSGYTPLALAAVNSYNEVVVTLLRAGADVEAVAKDGFTPLHKAVLQDRKNAQDLLAILLIYGADCNTLNKQRLTALQGALSAGKLSNARALCAFGADPSFKNTGGKNAFDFAKSLKQNGMVDVLSKWDKCGQQTRKALPQLLQFIKKEGQMDASAMLSWASREGQALLAEFILDFMAEETPGILESEGLKKGWKPLHHAAWAGQSSVAEILLAHGAAVEARTGTQKWTALHLAAGKGRQRTLRVLLNNGADILAMTEQVPRWVTDEESHGSEPSAGVTAFWLAAVGRHPKSLDVLLEHALCMKDDKSRTTALGYHKKAQDHLASLSGHEDDEKSVHSDSDSKKADRESQAAKPVPSLLPGFDMPGASGSFDGALSSVSATR